MLKANAIAGGVSVLSRETLPNGVRVLIVPCADAYREFKTLPVAVSLDGTTYGKTAWNSDRGIAYYRTDAVVAFRC